MRKWLTAVINGHLLDELGHLVLQFPDAFFIHGVCWISHSGTNWLDTLTIRLCDWICDCFGGYSLPELAQ